MKKYAVELFGTFTLTLVVITAIASGSTIVPVLAMLTLALYVYTIGHVSGCHINPAVTVGIWSLGKISAIDAAGYILAQFAGAFLAMTIASEVMGHASTGLIATGGSSIGIAEAIGMLFFAFGIAAAIYGKVQKQLSGVVIGGSLLLGLTIAGSVSNGVLNPAVAFGIGSFSVMYVIGPVIGSIIGMHLYKCLCMGK